MWGMAVAWQLHGHHCTHARAASNTVAQQELLTSAFSASGFSAVAVAAAASAMCTSKAR